MLWHPLFVFATGVINTIANGIAQFSITGQFDMFYTALAMSVEADKFFPIHDGVFPIFTSIFLVVVAAYSYKGVISIVNLLRGSGI